MSNRRWILTIATGKQMYMELAANLARSFIWWHPETDIKFRLVTDMPRKVPADIAGKIDVVTIRPGELGVGFTPKLYLDKLAPEGQTLFVDSDCLIFSKLDKIFEAFNGHKVSVSGNYIAGGEWFGDIDKICRRFNLPHIPKFNGGIYYLENGPEAKKVYELARTLEGEYDEIGFVRLRNRPNDEVLMALAMQIEGMTPVIDDSTFMSDPQACPGRYRLDIIKGKRLLINPPAPSLLHQSWYPFEKVSPVIVHFLGYYTQHYPYRREVYRLKKALNHQLNWLTNLQGRLFIEYPERIKVFLKNALRPIFRSVFGVRKVHQSERV
ncbi:hypothetical protein [Mucilaginibacter sp. L3T2-6]|uniref:hypothetical protein n=1 Tax=Mucilaginibacter sp. L3T2-6 TaxID=3062491 RepID=UPI002675CD20|nr:hypothetical protein [Mucilaginibacter sp. L3T2-6]MDO3643059.1 hypothetical protein [Mucilaginibacter sp. L3T2-6]MDV6215826.1 hypothetical protein [Mucilaginibacter sp. L3T2-6]